MRLKSKRPHPQREKRPFREKYGIYRGDIMAAKPHPITGETLLALGLCAGRLKKREWFKMG